MSAGKTTGLIYFDSDTLDFENRVNGKLRGFN